MPGQLITDPIAMHTVRSHDDRTVDPSFSVKMLHGTDRWSALAEALLEQNSPRHHVARSIE
jgi:hypothetical protein